MFMPSYAKFFQLPMQQLAQFRIQLLEVLRKEGMAGIKRVAAEAKRSTNLKEVWAIMRPVYGIPGSGLAFQNLIESTMKDIGLTSSLVVPGIFFGRNQQPGSKVADEWIIVAVSTDDFRYFGTEEMKARFEKDLDSKLKMDKLSVKRQPAIICLLKLSKI